MLPSYLIAIAASSGASATVVEVQLELHHKEVKQAGH